MWIGFTGNGFLNLEFCQYIYVNSNKNCNGEMYWQVIAMMDFVDEDERESVISIHDNKKDAYETLEYIASKLKEKGDFISLEWIK